MNRFRCAHCGGRLVVHARHLGRLVTCPECGKPTHPLAEEILAGERREREPRITLATQPAQRTCENCGQKLGTLQKLNVWRNHLVCTPCFETLSREGAPAAVAAGPETDDLPGAVQPVEIIDSPSPTRLPVKVTARPIEQPPSAGLPTLLFHGGWRTLPLPVRNRLLVVLGIICVAGAAVYGALSLLRDLAGLLTAAAFILLALFGGYLLLRASWTAGRRFVGTRLGSKSSDGEKPEAEQTKSPL